MTKFIAWGQRIFPKAIAQPPGNSLGIIDAAYEAGYDGIELDLRITKDRALVLMHDDGVEKTTLGTGRISQMTLEQATALRLRDEREGVWEFVPSFAQALLRNGSRGYVMVDLRKLNPVSEGALSSAIEIAKFDPRLLIFLAYTASEGLRYQELWPNSIVMLKAPMGLKPPELTAEFVEQAGAIEAVIAPIFAFPEVVAEFRERTRKAGKMLGVYLHHQGPDKLRQIMAAKPDFITSMNPTHFAAMRKEFGLAEAVFDQHEAIVALD